MIARKHKNRATKLGLTSNLFPKINNLVKNKPLPSDPQWKGGACATHSTDEGVYSLPCSSFVLPKPRSAQTMLEITTPPWKRMRVDRRATALVACWLRGGIGGLGFRRATTWCCSIFQDDARRWQTTWITSLGHGDIRSVGAFWSALRVSDSWERHRREIRDSIARMETNTVLVSSLEVPC